MGLQEIQNERFENSEYWPKQDSEVLKFWVLAFYTKPALLLPSPGLSTLLMISKDQGSPGCYPRSLAPALFILALGQSQLLNYRTCL